MLKLDRTLWKQQEKALTAEEQVKQEMFLGTLVGSQVRVMLEEYETAGGTPTKSFQTGEVTGVSVSFCERQRTTFLRVGLKFGAIRKEYEMSSLGVLEGRVTGEKRFFMPMTRQ